MHQKYLAPTFLKVNISYFVSWATMVICWSSGLAKSTIWTLPTPEAEILLLTMADTDCSVVMGNASKALSDVGDNEHNPEMKKKNNAIKNLKISWNWIIPLFHEFFVTLYLFQIKLPFGLGAVSYTFNWVGDDEKV